MITSFLGGLVHSRIKREVLMIMKYLKASTLLVCILFLVSCTNNNFKIKMDYKNLNGENTKNMDLLENDQVEISINNTSGESVISIFDSNGQLIKKESVLNGNKNFVFDILKSGVYKISVQGKNATGNVEVIKK